MLAILAVGVAAVLAVLLRFMRDEPRAAFSALGGLALLLGASLYVAASQAMLQGELPVEGPTTFERRVRATAGRWAASIDARIGDPFALPASLPFALRHQVEPSRYSCVVGRSFLEPRAADGAFRGIELLDLTAKRDLCLLAYGFSPAPSPGGPARGRLVRGQRARVLLPVHTPTAVRLHVRHTAERACKVLVLLDGTPVGGFAAGPGEAPPATLVIPRSRLRSAVQDLDLLTSAPACLRVQALLLEPLPAR